MPKGYERKRYRRIRTVTLPHHEGYFHIGVLRHKGKRGGTTEKIGPIHHYKAKRLY